jgi:glycosyltransferase involved in cell wall biosynthesis
MIVSDDGSTDETKKILTRFATSSPQKVIVREGPHQGFARNFLFLATDPSIQADFFAYSDQDDIWHRDKIKLALQWLNTVPNDTPALYCSRAELIDTEGRTGRMSPLMSRPLTFRNALVQSINGNTIVFNRAAKILLEAAGPQRISSHDWWTYQLVAGAGGQLHYDANAWIKYRQHSRGTSGPNYGWRARLLKMSALLKGELGATHAIHIAALKSLPPNVISSENRRILKEFSEIQVASLFKRLYLLWKSGVYRQTVVGNCVLIAATLLKKF